MKVSAHIIIGLIVSIALVIMAPSFFGINILIVFLSSVLIDVDHVFGVWMWKWKICLNPKKAFNDCMHLPEGPFIPLHSIEFLLIIAVISMMFSYYFVLIGMLIHFATDYIDCPKRLKTRFYLFYLLFDRLFWRKKEKVIDSGIIP